MAPISPTDMIASLVPGGTGIRLTTRVQFLRDRCVQGPSDPREQLIGSSRLRSQEVDHEAGLGPLALAELDVLLPDPDPQLDRLRSSCRRRRRRG